MTKTVPCPSCGQAIILEMSEDIDDVQVLQMAAFLQCNCPEARTARMKKQQADEAKLNIEELCSSSNDIFEPIEDKEAIDFMFRAVDLISNGKFSGIGINLGGNSRIQISLGGKEQIKVKRTLNVSAQLEANSKI